MVKSSLIYDYFSIDKLLCNIDEPRSVHLTDPRSRDQKSRVIIRVLVLSVLGVHVCFRSQKFSNKTCNGSLNPKRQMCGTVFHCGMFGVCFFL